MDHKTNKSLKRKTLKTTGFIQKRNSQRRNYKNIKTTSWLIVYGVSVFTFGDGTRHVVFDIYGIFDRETALMITNSTIQGVARCSIAR